jgi:hypothetical protein
MSQLSGFQPISWTCGYDLPGTSSSPSAPGCCFKIFLLRRKVYISKFICKSRCLSGYATEAMARCSASALVDL